MMLTHFNRSRFLDLPTRILERFMFFAAMGVILALGLLAGCATPGTPLSPGGGLSGVNQQIINVLTQLGNKLIPDLQQMAAVANAATPPDTDGAQCVGALPNPAVSGDAGTGALAVATAIQKVAAVTNGLNVGALTTAEIATLYQPGSAQFNWAVKVLETACIAKVHDVNQAINSTAGIFTALPGILALTAAPVGM